MPLTRQQFRGIIKARGYTQGEVARLWGITPARLSQIARDPERQPMYEYALWGLPPRRTAELIAARRTLAARQFALPGKDPRAADPPTKDVWDDLTQMGAVFVVQAEQGEHLPEGCEGIVVQREQRKGELQISLLFDSGYRESFPLSYLRDPRCFLTATGGCRDGQALTTF